VGFRDRIEVEVGKQTLRAALNETPHASSPRLGTQQLQQDSSDVIRLEVKARLKGCGGEMRLVLPPDRSSQAPSHLVSSLLKALARARQWYEWIVAGEVSGQRAIAQRLGLNERYVGRVLECAFLAPDIVEAILDGHQPSDLRFERLTRRLPLSWIEQREQLGFPSLAPTAIGIDIDSLLKAFPVPTRIRESNSLISPENSLFGSSLRRR
jgi:hypothetical protein